MVWFIPLTARRRCLSIDSSPGDMFKLWMLIWDTSYNQYIILNWFVYDSSWLTLILVATREVNLALWYSHKCGLFYWLITWCGTLRLLIYKSVTWQTRIHVYIMLYCSYVCFSHDFEDNWILLYIVVWEYIYMVYSRLVSVFECRYIILIWWLLILYWFR